MDHQAGDQMLSDLFGALELPVDAKVIAQAVRERNFEGAQFVAISMSTAAYMVSGETDVFKAVDAAVGEIDRRRKAAQRYLDHLLNSDRSGGHPQQFD